MNVDKLINKLNKLINENDLRINTKKLSNELFETLKIIENCTSCKKDEKTNTYAYYLDKYLAELEKEEPRWEIGELNNKLNCIDSELNKKVLCEGCKEKKIGKLTDKCGNEEIARFL